MPQGTFGVPYSDLVLFPFCLLHYEFVYYSLNQILSSDWFNTSLTLGDVWLVESNVRLVANLKKNFTFKT